MIQQKIVWNDAMRGGLVLGGVSIVYMICNLLLTEAAGASSAAVSVIASVGSVLLWVFKFLLCLQLFKRFMQRFASSHEEVTNRDTFRYGVVVALLSALVYSAFYLAWVTLIQPDALAESLDLAREAYASIMTADQLESFEEMLPKLPGMTFFLNFIYCFLFGTVLSSIYSRNIPSRNPFSEK